MATARTRRDFSAFAVGGVVGVVGGLIGLGGAEFRLPLLVRFFKKETLDAIVINLAVSFVTVWVSLFFRTQSVPLDTVLAEAPTILNLLAGTLLGSIAGVRFATRVPEHILRRSVVILLIGLSFILMAHHYLAFDLAGLLHPLVQMGLGIVAGIAIGIVSSMLGVAGGELLIPTLVLLFGLGIKVAGSVSLAISMPTIAVGLWRYHRNGRTRVFVGERRLIIWMAVGSVGGAFFGSRLLAYVTSDFLSIFLGIILLVSALKMYRHGNA